MAEKPGKPLPSWLPWALLVMTVVVGVLAWWFVTYAAVSAFDALLLSALSVVTICSLVWSVGWSITSIFSRRS